MMRGSIGAYIGFDCTADSLHVGSLVQIMFLRLLQRHGHKPIALVGGGTTKIGDPSFREEGRSLLDEQAIEKNLRGIRACLEKYLRDGKQNEFRIVNNDTWLGKLKYIDLLRDVGSFVSINRMVTTEGVRNRMKREQGLTFLEFNYSILQGYDFRELYRQYGVRLQVGGSDQWGNIIAGVEIIRRSEGVRAFGLTTPLITTASGAKMGKTAQGARWLTADKLDPYGYWQFWDSTADADVGRFLRLFTDLPLKEIADLERLDLEKARKTLAREATSLAHGVACAQDAEDTAKSWG